jgi:hypothetical protein
MFDIHCHHCETRYLLSLSQIDSLHNTSEGPIAYATCPRGHHVVRRFRVQRDPRPRVAQAA